MEQLSKKRSNHFECNRVNKRRKVFCDNSKINCHKEIKKVACLICMSDFNENDIIKIHKDHFNMCKDCLTQQGTALLRNRDLLPWKCSCCQEELSLKILEDVLESENYNKLLSRQMETIIGKTISCQVCDSTYCIPNEFNDENIQCNICDNIIELNEKPKVDINDINNLLNLAGQYNWAQCPGCHELIEKIDGCNSMTHHETNGSVTHFCYQCNEILDSNDIDTLGRQHFPNGSYNDCINMNHSLNEIEHNANEIDDSINYENFNWGSENEESEYDNNQDSEYDDNEDEYYYCTECDYYSYNYQSLQQHINAKNHYERFYCPGCSYYGYSYNSLQQHRNAKYH